MIDSFLTLNNFFTALRSVPLGQVMLELLVIGAVVYWVIRFLQGTRGARLLKGIVFVLITLYLGVRFLGAFFDLTRLEVLFDRFLFYASFAIIIVFQPELRRALMRLGETRLFRGIGQSGEDEIEQIVEACATLSRRRIGALIAMERDVPLGGYTEQATRINGDVTSALIQTIFYPNTALHDLGMIISGGKVAWAGVQFPLAESGDLPRELGSRHRAAVGLSTESDAVIIIVSEETGDISIAERGQLYRRRTVEQLRQDLTEKMGQSVTVPFEDERPRPSVVADRSRATAAGDRTTAGATRADERPTAAPPSAPSPAPTAGESRAGDGKTLAPVPAAERSEAASTEPVSGVEAGKSARPARETPREPAPIREIKPVGGSSGVVEPNVPRRSESTDGRDARPEERPGRPQPQEIG